MKSTRKTSSTTRFTIDLSEKSAKRLETLMNLTEAESKAEVVRNALRAFEYIVNKQEEGYDFCLMKDGVVAPAGLFGASAFLGQAIKAGG